MNELIKNKQFAIASSVAALLLAAFIIFVYWPKHNSVRGIEKRIRKIDDEIKTTHSAIGDIRNLGKALAAMQRELNDFEERLPAEEELSSILSEITDIARRHSIEVVSVKPEKPVLFHDADGRTFEFEQKKVKKVTVFVHMKGPYRSLVECMKTLRDSVNILAVLESVSILRNEDIAPHLKADFVLSIFVLG